MKRNIVFFANTLWFLEKFKYELIKELSLENKITCLYFREGPPYNIEKIRELNEFHDVKFVAFKSFAIKFLFSLINNYLKYNFKNPKYHKIIIFTIGPIIISSLLPSFYKKRTTYVLEGLGRVFSSKKNINNIIKLIVVQIYRFLFSKCQSVFVLNSHDFLFLVENNICPIYKLAILPGTGLDCLKIDKILKLPKKIPKYIDYVGRLIVEKGFYKFILARLNFQNYYPEIDQLYTFRIISPKKDIDNLSPKELNFLNYLNIELKPYMVEPYPYYLESKALIVPSSYGEGLSRVVLEASYLGIPILASRIRGIEEILPSDYKYFIKSNNPFSISQQLALMIEDNEYFLKIKEKQKLHIKNNFSMNISVSIFIERLFKK